MSLYLIFSLKKKKGTQTPPKKSQLTEPNKKPTPPESLMSLGAVWLFCDQFTSIWGLKYCLQGSKCKIFFLNVAAAAGGIL